MLKRISAIVLSMCILAMMPVVLPVSAVSNALADDFENASDNIINGTTDGEDYYYASDNGLLIKPSLRMWSNHLSIAEGRGYNGSDALYVSCDKSKNDENKYRGTVLMTKGITLTDDNAVVLRYKINIEDYPAVSRATNIIRLSGIRNDESSEPVTSTTPFEVGSNGGTPYFINTKNTSQKFEFTENTWYTVVTKISGTGAEKDWQAYLLDEDNKVLLSISDELKSGVIAENQPIYFRPCYVLNSVVTEGETPIKFLIDDLSLTEYTTNQKPSIDFANSNIVNNQKDVPINKVFNVAFDQEIALSEAENITLYKAEDANKTPVDITISNVTFNGFTIKADANLDVNTDYILDFSGITNSAMLELDSKTISFTTVNPSMEPLSLSGASLAGGRTLTDGSTEVNIDESFILTFDKNIAEPIANTDIKMYINDEGKTKVEVAVDFSGNKVTVTPQEKLLLNTDYILDFAGVLSDTFGSLAEDSASQLSFKTSVRREMLFYEDDVEAATVGAITAYQSDVFSVNSSKLTVIENGGYNNSKGIRLNKAAGVNGYGITTKKYELDASEKLYFEFKLNVSKVTGAVGRVYVNDAGHENTLLQIETDKYGYPYIRRYSATYPYYLRLNKWHTIVCEISADEQNVYIFDENGKELYDASYSGNTVIENIGNSVSLYPIFAATAGELDAVIDDLKVYRLSDHALKLEELNSDITDGEANVVTDNTVMLAFNQPLYASADELADGFELLENGEKIDASLKRIGAGNISVTTDNGFVDGTEYTIKLPKVAAISGNSAESVREISFTTKNMYSVKATGTSLDIADAIIAAGEATLTLQNNGEALTDAVIVVAMYAEGRPQKLKKMKVFEDVSVPKGTSAPSLKFTEQYQGVDSVEFFLYDSIDNLKPLMRGYKITR